MLKKLTLWICLPAIPLSVISRTAKTATITIKTDQAVLFLKNWKN